MNKMIATGAAALAACTVFAKTAMSDAPPETISDCKETYILRDYEGYVACFDEGADEPFLVTGTLVANLRPLDEIMLRDGVELHGAQAVSRALEDYCS
ncbi:MAG: hypothetical protein IIZ59_01605 [Clostridia bacterium]|nr:hypothetical protein [Clostridia bacterium]